MDIAIKVLCWGVCHANLIIGFPELVSTVWQLFMCFVLLGAFHVQSSLLVLASAILETRGGSTAAWPVRATALLDAEQGLSAHAVAQAARSGPWPWVRAATGDSQAFLVVSASLRVPLL